MNGSCFFLIKIYSFKYIFLLLQNKQNVAHGVPLWHSGLRTQCCHCSSLGHCSGVDSIPGLGTSICLPHASWVAKNKNKKIIIIMTQWSRLIWHVFSTIYPTF